MMLFVYTQNHTKASTVQGNAWFVLGKKVATTHRLFLDEYCCSSKRIQEEDDIGSHQVLPLGPKQRTA